MTIETPRYYGDGKHDDWPWLDYQWKQGKEVKGLHLWIGRAIETDNPAYLPGAALVDCVVTAMEPLKGKMMLVIGRASDYLKDE